MINFYQINAQSGDHMIYQSIERMMIIDHHDNNQSINRLIHSPTACQGEMEPFKNCSRTRGYPDKAKKQATAKAALATFITNLYLPELLVNVYRLLCVWKPTFLESSHYVTGPAKINHVCIKIGNTDFFEVVLS